MFTDHLVFRSETSRLVVAGKNTLGSNDPNDIDNLLGKSRPAENNELTSLAHHLVVQ
jgi:hypothetical protein